MSPQFKCKVCGKKYKSEKFFESHMLKCDPPKEVKKKVSKKKKEEIEEEEQVEEVIEEVPKVEHIGPILVIPPSTPPSDMKKRRPDFIIRREK